MNDPFKPQGKSAKLVIDGKEFDLGEIAAQQAGKITINGKEIDLSRFNTSGDKVTINGQEYDLGSLSGTPQFGSPSMITPTKRRRSPLGCLFGSFISILIIGSTVLGCGAAALAVLAPNALNGVMTLLTGISAPETKAVPGDAKNFDPYATLQEVTAFAGTDVKLTDLDVYYVRSDGTLDLTATYKPAPNVQYKFAQVVPRPTDAAPVGASSGKTWYKEIEISAYEPGQRRHVNVSKGGVSAEYDYVNDGMTKEVSDPRSGDPKFLDPPKCAIKDFWKAALDKGAPKDAVATVRYDSSGYDFSISGASIFLRFDANCKLK